MNEFLQGRLTKNDRKESVEGGREGGREMGIHLPA